MAEQVFNVECGFFDSVNLDRLYSADDMCRPYTRLVSNGVYATQAGTPSDDFRVIPSSGLTVIVKTGAGILADKWFYSTADISVTLDSNNGILNRIDSIIAQVDTRTTGRVGNIVYRPGTPASNPTPPAINTVTGVMELRLANITVAPSASSVSAASISDERGSADCPWITSLIDQVDTSVLFNQWQTAYQQFYNSSTAQFNAYFAQQRQAWEDFVEQAQTDLSATNNVVHLIGTINTYGDTGEDVYNVQETIPSYDPETDMLNVYINGLLLNETMWYRDEDLYPGGAVIRHNPGSGNKITFEVVKSVVASDLASTLSAVESLDQKVSGFMNDTGWQTLQWQNGASAYDSSNTPKVRKVGGRVYLCGAVKGATSANTVYTMLSAGYYPAQMQYLTAPIISGTTVRGTCVFSIDTSGNVTLLSTSVTIGSGDMVPIDYCFVV